MPALEFGEIEQKPWTHAIQATLQTLGFLGMDSEPCLPCNVTPSPFYLFRFFSCIGFLVQALSTIKRILWNSGMDILIPEIPAKYVTCALSPGAVGTYTV